MLALCYGQILVSWAWKRGLLALSTSHVVPRLTVWFWTSRQLGKMTRTSKLKSVPPPPRARACAPSFCFAPGYAISMPPIDWGGLGSVPQSRTMRIFSCDHCNTMTCLQSLDAEGNVHDVKGDVHIKLIYLGKEGTTPNPDNAHRVELVCTNISVSPGAGGQ